MHCANYGVRRALGGEGFTGAGPFVDERLLEAVHRRVLVDGDALGAMRVRGAMLGSGLGLGSGRGLWLGLGAKASRGGGVRGLEFRGQPVRERGNVGLGI